MSKIQSDTEHLILNADGSGKEVRFQNNGTQNVVIDSSGNVGIGTASPSNLLHLYQTNNPVITIEETNGSLSLQQSGVNGYINNTASGGSLIFRNGTSNTERMRIDSSGNLLVGTTTSIPAGASQNVTGIAMQSDGQLQASADGQFALALNRKTSDGEITVFRKNGNIVGSIGSATGGTTYIDGGSTYGGITFGGNGSTEGRIVPRQNGAIADNKTDLGTSSYRFKNLYLSGGVYVGGTGSANYLDDYEEGTWTATLSDQASGGNLSSTTGLGTYTKVGNMVTVYLTYFNISLTGLTSGNTAYVQGLPFVCASTGGSSRGYGTLQLNSASNTDKNIIAKVDDGYSSIVMMYGNGSAQTSYAVSDFSHGSVDIFTTITYRTNA